MVVSIVLVNLLNKAKYEGTVSEDHQSSGCKKDVTVKSEPVSKIHSHQIVENAL
jgi:hypothetical protein